MRGAAALISVAALGFLLHTASWAENPPEFAPMQKFVVRPIAPASPSPAPLDRSADGYARCAGYYLYVAKLVETNKSAIESDALLMTKAFALGGLGKAEALRALREHESVLVEQRQKERDALVRRVNDMDEQERAALSSEQQEEILRPLYAEVLLQSACNQLVQELRAEGFKP